jgi:hypothetical protein
MHAMLILHVLPLIEAHQVIVTDTSKTLSLTLLEVVLEAGNAIPR